jgi:pyridoxamine 5'-phosphate oxidase
MRASHQSEVIADREVLKAREHELGKQFPGDVPLPPFWGGYILRPERIEFWQGQPNRLHDRFRYTRQADGAWTIERLSP